MYNKEGQQGQFSPLADEITQPLPQATALNLQAFLEKHALSLRDVANASGVRMLVIWNVLHGRLIPPEQAGQIRMGLFVLTREHYRGPIPVRSAPRYTFAALQNIL